MRTSSVLPKREASRKHWLTLSAPPSTSKHNKPWIAVADIPVAHPGSNELEKRVSGKQAASKASVKSFPVSWLPAKSRNILKADNWSWISAAELWVTRSLFPWHPEWKPMHFRAHSVNFWTLVPASAFKTSSPLHSWRRSHNLQFNEMSNVGICGSEWQVKTCWLVAHYRHFDWRTEIIILDLIKQYRNKESI